MTVENSCFQNAVLAFCCDVAALDLLTFIQSVFTSTLAQRAMQSAGIARGGMSVCLFVRLRYCITTKKASVMIYSPSESLKILVSRNIWFITKLDRGHPERGRFLRLGWVRTGDFGDFYQRVSIASYANLWYSQMRNVRPSVRHTPVLYQNEES